MSKGNTVYPIGVLNVRLGHNIINGVRKYCINCKSEFVHLQNEYYVYYKISLDGLSCGEIKIKNLIK